MKRKAFWALLACWVVAPVGCHHETAASGWIQGDSDQRWQTVERQLRGLDVAMVEMGYRYEELYWSGMDSNWEYAVYQLAKVNLSLENALERRPKRRASAEELFLPLLDEMKRAVAAREGPVFEKAFAELTAGCNACHVAEGVASFHVEPPSVRISPIRAPR